MTMQKSAFESLFANHLFWDVDKKKIDPEGHARFVIGRVLMRGNRQDWNSLKTFYGLERIEHESLQLRYLDKKTLAFVSCYFNRDIKEFRCTKQLF